MTQLTHGEKCWFWLGLVAGVVLSAAIMLAGAILSVWETQLK